MTTERVQLAGVPGTEGLRYGNWGIVQARGHVGGKPVLFVRQRVSYGGEVDSAVTYVEIMNPDVINGAEDFQRAFARFNFTFNWFYSDDRDIAYQLGGAYPTRAQGTDLDLPVRDGTEWRWQDLLSFDETPKDVSPAKGYITSWNNKQAPGFRAADDNWGFASVDRVQPLDDRIEAATTDDGRVDLVELVKAMADAATVDLRGDKVLPYMLNVIGDPGTDRLRQAAAVLDTWHRSGAHRRDMDGNGAYDHAPAVALMDEWWERALSAIFEPVLKAAFDDVPYTHDDHPGLDGNGSAFNDGWYGHVHKDLRSVLGLPVEGDLSRQYCGSGAGLAACRDALLKSLDEAVAALEARDGADPASWNTDEEADQIQFAALGVQGQEPMQWQNRPTFQQVLEFAP
jgi:acyl-homoserine lactone acylase PvdQ